MIKNLNEMSATTLNRLYNNTSDIQLQFNSEIGRVEQFTRSRINSEGRLVVDDIHIKNCVIVTPSGQVWNSLDYIHKTRSNGSIYTEINFQFLEEYQWQDGKYTIYIGNSEEGSFLKIPNLNANEHNIVEKENNLYSFKKITSDNTLNIQQIDDMLLFSIDENVSTECIPLTSEIDCSEYSTQLFYVLENAVINDIINGKIVTILLYKPNKTILTYNNQVILNPYDIGWYTFVIKKIFNKLFIGQPTKVITDYVPEISTSSSSSSQL